MTIHFVTFPNGYLSTIACGRSLVGGYGRSITQPAGTRNQAEVTCKNCLKKLAKKALRNNGGR